MCVYAYAWAERDGAPAHTLCIHKRAQSTLATGTGAPARCPRTARSRTRFSAAASRAFAAASEALSLSYAASWDRSDSTSLRLRASGSLSRLFSWAISYLRAAAGRGIPDWGRAASEQIYEASGRRPVQHDAKTPPFSQSTRKRARGAHISFSFCASRFFISPTSSFRACRERRGAACAVARAHIPALPGACSDDSRLPF